MDGFRLPGGPVYSKAGMMTFPAANAIYRRETYDNYPAARAILQVVYEGLQLPIDLALRGRVALVREDPALAGSGRDDPLAVRLDAGAQQGRAPARRACRRRQLKKVGVLGAGFMGAGIAYVTAQAGLDVVLIDRDQESADKGKAHSEKLMTDQVNRGRATAAERDALLARITRPPTMARSRTAISSSRRCSRTARSRPRRSPRRRP